jgi:hypothetical protein
MMKREKAHKPREGDMRGHRDGESEDYDAILQLLKEEFLSKNDPKQKQGQITQDFITRKLSNSTAHVNAVFQARIDFVNDLIKWLTGSLESRFQDIALFKFQDELLATVDQEYAKLPGIINPLLVQAGLATKNLIDQYKEKMDEAAEKTKKRIRTYCAISERRSTIVKRAAADNKPVVPSEIKSPSETRTDECVKRIKNHPVISILIIIGIIIIALGAFMGGLDNILRFLDERVLKLSDSKTTPLQDIMDTSILTATATVDIIIASDKAEGKTSHIAPGNYVAFGKGSEALLVMSSTECTSEQTGERTLRYYSTVSLEATSRALNQPLSMLKEAEYVQICLEPMPSGSHVLSGKALCVFNGDIPMEIPIKPQRMTGELIIIRDIDRAFEEVGRSSRRK